MNILFIVPYVPSLIRVRPFNLIRSLSSRGHKITLLTLWTDEEERATLKDLNPYCHKIFEFHLPSWRSMTNCALVLPTRTPLQAVYCWQPELANLLYNFIKDNKHHNFDVIHIEHLRGAKYGVELLSMSAKNRTIKPPPIVWDSVDNISHLFRQASETSKTGFGRWMTKLDLPRTEYYEGWLPTQFDQVLVTSAIDKKAFLALIPNETLHTNISVVPNGVDLDYFKAENDISREEATLVISGKMSYHANVNMVLYLINEIMPLIWNQRADVKLWVVGKDPSPEILALAENPAITVTGFVESILPYLQKATLAVAPIQYGAGIQNKVLEAMACGTPVVSTPKAVSAINVNHGKEILLGDAPETFAESVLKLLNDSDLRHQIGNAGQNFVGKNHRWDHIAKRVENIYSLAIRERNIYSH